MNRSYKIFCLLFFTLSSFFSRGSSIWQRVAAPNPMAAEKRDAPVKYIMYTLDELMLKSQLANLSFDPAFAQIIELPLPDGTLKYFRVWQSALLPAGLAAKYPELHTYTGEAVDDHNVTAKLDFTSFGFHAIIFDHNNISFTDPADNTNGGYYTVHYKKDERRIAWTRSKCLTGPDQIMIPKAEERTGRLTERVTNGNQLRTYRLALSCDHQYAKAATGLAHPTVAQTLSKLITSLNRIDGVYERELAVTMNFVANEDTLIWTDTTVNVNGPDPFGTIDGNAAQCILTNQKICDTLIGSANYDIGHVFTTGAGGLSQQGIVCLAGMKAESATGQPNPVGDGFDIDYVSHEMGHEFGADHPFNNGIDGSCCCGTIVPEYAYEPGSGSTIMAYAGICAPDDVQPHSDAYFHSCPSVPALLSTPASTIVSLGNIRVADITGKKERKIGPAK